MSGSVPGAKVRVVVARPALLLVDSTQGVQAQTLANFRTASHAQLAIIPVLTKLDLPHSDPAKAIEQIEQAFGFHEDEILWTSAKSGEGVDEIPPALIARVPPPTSRREVPFRGLIIDSWHNSFRGVTCLLSSVDGAVSKGDEIAMASTGKKFEVQEVGLLTPSAVPVATLHSGHVGKWVGCVVAGCSVAAGGLSCQGGPVLALRS